MKKGSYEKRRNAYEGLIEAKENFAKGNVTIVNTLYPHSPDELRYEDLEENPPNKPSFSQGIPLGTDVSGRDVLSLLLYGFRLSITFAIVVATCGYFVGILVGGMQGYYGGWIDILSQRFVEIWGSIPFLFLIMIIGSMITPTFWLLAILLVVLRSWLGITYYVRGEFYREKAKDYVQAAIGAGVKDLKIITKHILPNALVPVVTFAPFGIVAYISSLVSLDYLGFGLPPGTPSWGALMRQGLENMLFYPHLLIVPIAALAMTLYSVVMIGEAVREAFDPKVFSRLR
jgi:microcin C transport system permease protein